MYTCCPRNIVSVFSLGVESAYSGRQLVPDTAGVREELMDCNSYNPSALPEHRRAFTVDRGKMNLLLWRLDTLVGMRNGVGGKSVRLCTIL